MTSKAKLVAQRGEVDQPAKDAQDKLNEYVKEQLPGLASKDLFTLSESMKNLDIHIRQINVNPTGASLNNLGGAGLVDRCQSCHLGTDPLLVPVTMTLTKADLGLAKSNDAPFTSHPDPDMMKYHPLEKFGCSPCHGGNGRALDTVEKGARPLRTLALAALLSGKFRRRLPAVPRFGHGHRARPGPEQGQAALPRKGLHRLPPLPGLRQSGRTARQRAAGDHAARKPEAGRSPADRAAQQEGRHRPRQRHGEPLLHASHQPDRHDVGHGRARSKRSTSAPHNLLQEIKKVGPDLKEVRMKIHKEWIPYWIGHTHEFRPTTKMPQFRLQDDEIQAISAYIWQSAITGPELPKQAPGNAAHGKVAVRRARLRSLPLDRRRREHGRRRFRRESLPRRREGQLRLSGSLDPESAHAHASL